MWEGVGVIHIDDTGGRGNRLRYLRWRGTEALTYTHRRVKDAVNSSTGTGTDTARPLANTCISFVSALMLFLLSFGVLVLCGSQRQVGEWRSRRRCGRSVPVVE